MGERSRRAVVHCGRHRREVRVVANGSGLETERERAPALARKLTLHKLRSKVTVEDRSAAMDVAVVFGPGAEKCNSVPSALSYVDPRLPALGVRVLLPAGLAAKLLGLPEAPVAEYMKRREIAISVDIGIGRGSATVWTCDLTHGYIDINASYRS